MQNPFASNRNIFNQLNKQTKQSLQVEEKRQEKANTIGSYKANNSQLKFKQCRPQPHFQIATKPLSPSKYHEHKQSSLSRKHTHQGKTNYFKQYQHIPQQYHTKPSTNNQEPNLPKERNNHMNERPQQLKKEQFRTNPQYPNKYQGKANSNTQVKQTLYNNYQYPSITNSNINYYAPQSTVENMVETRQFMGKGSSGIPISPVNERSRRYEDDSEFLNLKELDKDLDLLLAQSKNQEQLRKLLGINSQQYNPSYKPTQPKSKDQMTNMEAQKQPNSCQYPMKAYNQQTNTRKECMRVQPLLAEKEILRNKESEDKPRQKLTGQFGTSQGNNLEGYKEQQVQYKNINPKLINNHILAESSNNNEVIDGNDNYYSSPQQNVNAIHQQKNTSSQFYNSRQIEEHNVIDQIPVFNYREDKKWEGKQLEQAITSQMHQLSLSGEYRYFLTSFQKIKTKKYTPQLI